MPGLVPASTSSFAATPQGVDGRDKPGHDDESHEQNQSSPMPTTANLIAFATLAVAVVLTPGRT
jgi:hypothetical protein